MAVTLVDLANVALAQHRPHEALPLAQRALVLREQGGVGPMLMASVRFTLARALWGVPAAAGGDRANALALATRAREAFRALGEPEAENLAEVDAWLAAHSSE